MTKAAGDGTGVGAAEGDHIGGCNVSPAGYSHLTDRLLQLAEGRVVLALEGCGQPRIYTVSRIYTPCVTNIHTNIICHEYNTCHEYNMCHEYTHQEAAVGAPSGSAF